MSFSYLKVVHPYSNMLFASVVCALCSFYFVSTEFSLIEKTTHYEIHLNHMFWVGLIMYFVSIIAFLFLKMAKRFKRMPAGERNLGYLEIFERDYPDIAKELNTKTLRGATYGEYRELQKRANRLVISQAASGFSRSSKREGVKK